MAYFKYPPEIRRVIYTNAIEDVDRQFSKLTTTKGAFPNENSLLKLLYVRNSECYEEMDYSDPEFEFDTLAAGYLF